MAELHTTDRIRELAAVLPEAAAGQGADFPGGDFVEQTIADRVMLVAGQLGVTTRTALNSYVGQREIREWG